MNMYRLFFCIFLFICAGLAQAAAICPDINDIKAGSFNGWLPLNFNNDEPASPKAIAEFKKTIRHFSDAAWSDTYEHGQGRCHYDSEAEVYLASNSNPLPERPTVSPWSWDGIVAHCRAILVTGCPFT